MKTFIVNFILMCVYLLASPASAQKQSQQWLDKAQEVVVNSPSLKAAIHAAYLQSSKVDTLQLLESAKKTDLVFDETYTFVDTIRGNFFVIYEKKEGGFTEEKGFGDTTVVVRKANISALYNLPTADSSYSVPVFMIADSAIITDFYLLTEDTISMLASQDSTQADTTDTEVVEEKSDLQEIRVTHVGDKRSDPWVMTIGDEVVFTNKKYAKRYALGEYAQYSPLVNYAYGSYQQPLYVAVPSYGYGGYGGGYGGYGNGYGYGGGYGCGNGFSLMATFSIGFGSSCFPGQNYCGNGYNYGYNPYNRWATGGPAYWDGYGLSPIYLNSYTNNNYYGSPAGFGGNGGGYFGSNLAVNPSLGNTAEQSPEPSAMSIPKNNTQSGQTGKSLGNQGHVDAFEQGVEPVALNFPEKSQSDQSGQNAGNSKVETTKSKVGTSNLPVSELHKDISEWGKGAGGNKEKNHPKEALGDISAKLPPVSELHLNGSSNRGDTNNKKPLSASTTKNPPKENSSGRVSVKDLHLNSANSGNTKGTKQVGNVNTTKPSGDAVASTTRSKEPQKTNDNHQSAGNKTMVDIFGGIQSAPPKGSDGVAMGVEDKRFANRNIPNSKPDVSTSMRTKSGNFEKERNVGPTQTTSSNPSRTASVQKPQRGYTPQAPTGNSVGMPNNTGQVYSRGAQQPPRTYQPPMQQPSQPQGLQRGFTPQGNPTMGPGGMPNRGMVQNTGGQQHQTSPKPMPQRQSSPMKMSGGRRR